MQKHFKVGIVLNNLGANQPAYMAIKYANYIMNKSNTYDITLFYEELIQPCTEFKGSTMAINEMWHFDGLLIATNIDTAIKIARTTNPSKKIFYIWDLEWIRHGKQNYIHNLQAYRNPKLKLISRSISHTPLIENYCNRKIDAIIPDFNLEQIIGMSYE